MILSLGLSVASVVAADTWCSTISRRGFRSSSCDDSQERCQENARDSFERGWSTTQCRAVRRVACFRFDGTVSCFGDIGQCARALAYERHNREETEYTRCRWYPNIGTAEQSPIHGEEPTGPKFDAGSMADPAVVTDVPSTPIGQPMYFCRRNGECFTGSCPESDARACTSRFEAYCFGGTMTRRCFSTAAECLANPTASRCTRFTANGAQEQVTRDAGIVDIDASR